MKEIAKIAEATKVMCKNEFMPFYEETLD